MTFSLDTNMAGVFGYVARHKLASTHQNRITNHNRNTGESSQPVCISFTLLTVAKYHLDSYYTNLPIVNMASIHDKVNHTLAGIRLTEFFPTEDSKREL